MRSLRPVDGRARIRACPAAGACRRARALCGAVELADARRRVAAAPGAARGAPGRHDNSPRPASGDRQSDGQAAGALGHGRFGRHKSGLFHPGQRHARARRLAAPGEAAGRAGEGAGDGGHPAEPGHLHLPGSRPGDAAGRDRAGGGLSGDRPHRRRLGVDQARLAQPRLQRRRPKRDARPLRELSDRRRSRRAAGDAALHLRHSRRAPAAGDGHAGPAGAGGGADGLSCGALGRRHAAGRRSERPAERPGIGLRPRALLPQAQSGDDRRRPGALLPHHHARAAGGDQGDLGRAARADVRRPAEPRLSRRLCGGRRQRPAAGPGRQRGAVLRRLDRALQAERSRSRRPAFRQAAGGRDHAHHHQPRLLLAGPRRPGQRRRDGRQPVLGPGRQILHRLLRPAFRPSSNWGPTRSPRPPTAPVSRAAT